MTLQIGTAVGAFSAFMRKEISKDVFEKLLNSESI
jgi:hypothetical protein